MGLNIIDIQAPYWKVNLIFLLHFLSSLTLLQLDAIKNWPKTSLTLASWGGLQLYIVVVSSIFYPPPSSQFQYFAPKKTFTLLIMTKSRLDLGQYWLILPDFCTLTNFVLFLANIKFWLKWPSFCPKVSEYLNFFYPSPPRCAHNYNFIHQEVG